MLPEEDEWLTDKETGEHIYTFQLSDIRIKEILDTMVGWENLNNYPRLKFEVTRRGITKESESVVVSGNVVRDGIEHST